MTKAGTLKFYKSRGDEHELNVYIYFEFTMEALHKLSTLRLRIVQL